MAGLLRETGLSVGEEFPGLERPEIDSPGATVGLRELDAAGWTARFSVRVLSPRILGGWCCQVWAARAVRALTAAGLDCRTAEMEYHSGCDCFCVAVDAVMTVVPRGDVWMPGSRWLVYCNDAKQSGVLSFRAEQDLQRRIVGTHWKSEPVGITSGTGGWKLELVQVPDRDPTPVTEPFVLLIREGERQHRYTGCCWNETIWEHTQDGARLTRRGFALNREEV